MTERPPSGPVIVQNHYYADTAHEARVLELRRQANACRIDLGLPPGAILQRVAGDRTAPWLIWQQEFTDLSGWTQDLDVLAASERFGSIRQQQTAALSRFERVAYRPVGWQDR